MDAHDISGTRLVSSALGLGCRGFAGSYGSADRTESAQVIRLALDLGVNLLALTDFYGGGTVEQLVGKAIAGRRNEALIATQGGLQYADYGKHARIDGSPEYLKRACDASLGRLGVDCIDLYTLTQADTRVPIEESVGALGDLAQAGKVRYIGLRGVSGSILRRAHAEYPVSAVEGEYSLWEREVEEDLLPTARELAIPFVACSPLGRGFLTGRFRTRRDLAAGDARLADPRFKPGSLASNLKLLNSAEKMAAERDLSMGRLSLAWLLAQGSDIIPVPSTRQRVHMEMNASATRIRLTPGECDRLSALFPAETVAGAGEWRSRQTRRNLR